MSNLKENKVTDEVLAGSLQSKHENYILYLLFILNKKIPKLYKILINEARASTVQINNH